VAVDGGAPQNIPTGNVVPALNANATWGTGGRVIFEAAIVADGKVRKALYAVPDTGGAAEPVAMEHEAPPLEQAQRFFTEPSLATQNSVFFYGGAAGYDVSPDGQRFLVSHLNVEPSASPIHVVLNAVC
jgi:hypothetical protein